MLYRICIKYSDTILEKETYFTIEKVEFFNKALCGVLGIRPTDYYRYVK